MICISTHHCHGHAPSRYFNGRACAIFGLSQSVNARTAEICTYAFLFIDIFHSFFYSFTQLFISSFISIHLWLIFIIIYPLTNTVIHRRGTLTSSSYGLSITWKVIAAGRNRHVTCIEERGNSFVIEISESDSWFILRVAAAINSENRFVNQTNSKAISNRY